MMVRTDALKLLAKHRTDEAVITTMSVNHEWPAYSSNHELDFQIRGAMGQAAPVGIGVALGRPDRKVWVFNGDGSQLMYLGTLATIGHAAPKNLVLFIFENEKYERSGGQPIPLAGRLDFAGAARAMCIERAYSFDDLAGLESRIGEILKQEGPIVVVLKVLKGPRLDTPWPKMTTQAMTFERALRR